LVTQAGRGKGGKGQRRSMLGLPSKQVKGGVNTIKGDKKRKGDQTMNKVIKENQ